MAVGLILVCLRQIVAAAELVRAGNWAPLREAISAGPFVDVNRLLVAPADA